MIIQSNDEYHADVSRISKSGLDEIARSPAHYWVKYLDPNRVRKEPTPALITGSLIHTAILEPYEFNKRYAVAPDVDRRTSKGKADWAEFVALNAGKQVIDVDDYNTAMRCRDAVWSNSIAAQLLSEGIAERVFHWNDADTGAPCKCRPDFLSTKRWIVDVKSTEDAREHQFGRSSFNYRYHVQAPFYLDGVSAHTPVDGFLFIAVEKEPPYSVALYFADEEVLQLGRAEYKGNLATYVECLRNNEWPTYGGNVAPLTLPAYAFTNR